MPGIFDTTPVSQSQTRMSVACINDFTWSLVTRYMKQEPGTTSTAYQFTTIEVLANAFNLKPQDSFGRFVKIFLDLQKVDHTIRKHH